MPQSVDEDARRREIAQATLRIAEERGANAVTIRAVAEELGRSTAFVTNYVPSRAQLMFNALDLARGAWVDSRELATEGMPGFERLMTLSRWMVQSDEHDTALRSLWLEVLTSSGPEMKVVLDITDRTYEAFQDAATEAEIPDAQQIADVLYLFSRGFHVKNVEDPEVWSDERAQEALETLLKWLPSPPDTRPTN